MQLLMREQGQVFVCGYNYDGAYATHLGENCRRSKKRTKGRLLTADASTQIQEGKHSHELRIFRINQDLMMVVVGVVEKPLVQILVLV